MRRGGLLAARAALVAVARVLVVALAWVPPGGGPGPCPGPGLPPSVGRALRCLSWRWRAALRQGGGVYLPPALALQGPASSMALVLATAGVLYVVLALLLGTRCCGRFAPCPLSPSPLRGAGERCGGPHIHPSCNFLFIFWREYDRSKTGCASAQSCGNWSQTWKTWWKTARKWQET